MFRAIRSLLSFLTSALKWGAINKLRYLLGEDAISIDNNNLLMHVPYLGGLSLEANFSTPYGGISIDFTNIDEIISLNADNIDIIITLNRKAEKSRLFFPINPSPTISLILTATQISSIVGMSCSSTNTIRYRTIKDWVINLMVVLTDRTIVKTRQRPRKSAAGYNLINLFIGSEGTLGLVTEITLKLAVIPKETSVAIVIFPTIRDAIAAALKIQENIKLVKSIAKIYKSGDFKFAINAEEQKTLYILALYNKEGIEVSKKEIDDLGLTVSILGYVGDGNFHKSILYDALEMEGTYTSKHGIGLGKKESLLKELGLETIGVIKSIKGALDPY
ncbi:D-lactate dehydrogenase mitochondrial precursor [Cenococcum geophilum]